MWPKLMGSITFHNVVRFTVLLAYSHTVTTSLAYIITGKRVHISNDIPVYMCKNRSADYLGREILYYMGWLGLIDSSDLDQMILDLDRKIFQRSDYQSYS